jgi:hypothetical protein
MSLKSLRPDSHAKMYADNRSPKLVRSITSFPYIVNSL